MSPEEKNGILTAIRGIQNDITHIRAVQDQTLTRLNQLSSGLEMKVNKNDCKLTHNGIATLPKYKIWKERFDNSWAGASVRAAGFLIKAGIAVAILLLAKANQNEILEAIGNFF